MKKYYIYLATLGHIVNDSSQSVIPALIPFFVAQFHWNYEAAGLLIFANTAFSSILQPILGYYSDKFSEPRLIALGIFLSTASISSMAFLHSYHALFIASMIAGIGSAIFHPEGAKLVNRLGGKQKGKAMGTFAVGGSTGFAVGPVIAGLCAYKLGIEGLLIFFVFGLIVSSTLFILMPRIQKETIEIQKTASRTQEAVPPQNDWKSFGKLSIVLLGRSINFSVINTFIPLYWVQILHQSPEQGSFALTILFTIGIFVTYLGGVLADRYGFVKIMRLSLLIWLPSTLLITNVSSPLLGWIFLIPLGFARTLIYSPVVILGQTYLAKSIGFASGVTLGLTITLGGLFAPLVGKAADIYGLQNALQILNVSCAIALIASFFLTEHNTKMYPNGKPKSETSSH